MNEALKVQAIQLHKGGHLKKAEKAYLRLLGGARPDPELQYMLALLYHQTNRNELARPLLEKVNAVAPGAAPALALLARVLAALGRGGEAVEAARRCLRLQPGDAAMLNFLGRQLFQRGEYRESLDHFRKARELRPGSAAFLHDLALCRCRLGEVREAVRDFRQAVAIRPADAVFHYNLSQALREAGDDAAYRSELAETLRLDPDHLVAAYERLDTAVRECDWTDLEARKDHLRRLLEGYLDHNGDESIPPGPLNYIGMPPRLVSRVARHHARQLSARAAQLSHGLRRPAPDPGKKRLHIGYLSTDFYNHAVGTLTCGMFEHHDRSRFKVHAYSLRQREDEYQRAIAAGCDVYRDLTSTAARDAARRIIDDGIDILVDMAGYTGAARPEITALRPAPLQVSWLGYLDTMGADFIDYIIADPIVLPPEDEPRYREKVIRLPVFMVTSPLARADRTPGRAELGLPEGGFVFCSFNQAYKLDPATFAAWMRILDAVPDSVLWLYAGGSAAAQRNLTAAAEAHGIGGRRVVFAGRAPMDEHLARLAAAGLCLDTFNVGGGATMVCALLAGVPVLTCAGERYLSRMGSSMNRALGLAELDCRDEDEYVSRAVELAGRPQRLDDARRKLNEALTGNRLFRAEEFAASLEAAYERIWENHRLGRSPGPVEIGI